MSLPLLSTSHSVSLKVPAAILKRPNLFLAVTGNQLTDKKIVSSENEVSSSQSGGLMSSTMDLESQSGSVRVQRNRQFPYKERAPFSHLMYSFLVESDETAAVGRRERWQDESRAVSHSGHKYQREYFDSLDKRCRNWKYVVERDRKRRRCKQDI